MKRILFFTLFINLVASCKQSDLHVNISNIELDIYIKRLDRDLALANIDSIDLAKNAIKIEYKDFYKLYFKSVINLGDPDLPNFSDNLKLFLTDYQIYTSLNEVEKEFESIDFLYNELLGAFKHYKYYFPENIIPAVYTIISGFNQSLVVDDSVMAIALDKYLGRDSEIYLRLGVSKYISQNMHKNMIISDCMKAWALTEFPFNDSIDNLISNMIYNGKVHYFQKAMIPDHNDSIIMGYNEEELKWCEMYEKQIWGYLVEKKLFFETTPLLLSKFTREAPFTKDFGGSSPGRTANWMGWQIVKAYMKKNPEITLNQLMLNDNFMEILTQAKYKP